MLWIMFKQASEETTSRSLFESPQSPPFVGWACVIAPEKFTSHGQGQLGNEWSWRMLITTPKTFSVDVASKCSPCFNSECACHSGY